MGIEILSDIQKLQGIFTLIFIIISLIIGIRILLKYFKSKKFEHITLGCSWIFLTTGWLGSAVNFIFIIFNAELPEFYFLLLGNAFLPIAIICWLYSIFHILHRNLEKKAMTVVLSGCIPYEIGLLVLLGIDSTFIGSIESPLNSNLTLYPLIFQVIIILTTLITGIYFSLKSIKSDNQEIKWRGIFLLIAFISLGIGGIMDALFSTYTEFTLILIRLILISSSIEYYLGFFTPKFLLNWLVKEDQPKNI
ncbi:MAG: hypothetical protein GF329_03845 [Candidatus Lokiarchaeota archaeon]|nr:hypothetical protein [Candidatus Lokiarchaeota archaeon]